MKETFQQKLNHISFTKLITVLFLFINIVIIIFSLRSNPFSHALHGHDSSMFLYFGTGMHDGLVPYNDMFDHKGIILFWLQYLGVAIGLGNSSFGIWLLESAFYLVSAIFMYKIAYHFTQQRILSSLSILLYTGVTLASFDYGNYSEQFALPFITISLYLFIYICSSQPTNILYLFLIGLFGGLTFFIRSNMIALWITFCIYLLIKGIIKKQYQILLKQILFIFLGGIFVCLMILIYSLIVGNLREMIYQSFTLNILYADATPEQKKDTAKAFFRLATNYGIITFILPFLIAMLLKFQSFNKDNRQFYVITFVYLILNFLTVIISGRFYTHYFITMLPGLVLATAVGLAALFQDFPTTYQRFLCYLLLFLPTLSYTLESYDKYIVGTNTGVINEYYDSLEAKTADYIQKNSTSSDKIYVHNIDANIYLLSNRKANTKFFKLPAINYEEFTNLKDEFTNDFTKIPPKFIVIKKETYENDTPTDTGLDKTIINFIKNQYTVIPEFEQTELMLFELNQ